MYFAYKYSCCLHFYLANLKALTESLRKDILIILFSYLNYIMEQRTSLESPLIYQERTLSRYIFSKLEIVEEVKKQLLLAGPLVCVNFLINLLQVISVMFVGHLGELALSGASMATSFASVTGFSLLVRMVHFSQFQ